MERPDFKSGWDCPTVSAGFDSHLVNNGAVGAAMGQANGIQALDKSQQVIALSGDGGFNMLMSEFLTAAHHKLPVKVIVYDNSAFGLTRAAERSAPFISSHGFRHAGDPPSWPSLRSERTQFRSAMLFSV